MKNLKSIKDLLEEDSDLIDDLNSLGYDGLKGWVFMMVVENTLECLYIIADSEEYAANLLWTMNEEDLVTKESEQYEPGLSIEDAIGILKETFQDGNDNTRPVFKMLKWWDDLKVSPAYRKKPSRDFVGVNSKGYYNPIKGGEELKPIFSNSSIILDK